jgi:uncharacterized protein (TIGR03437 family)
MPPNAAPGSSTLQVTGPLGTAQQSLSLSATGPGVFAIGTAADGQLHGAILNQDDSINGAANPAQRGQYIQIFGTGLGATTVKGALATADTPVVVNVAGAPLAPSFAGLTPGIAGLYQVNVLIPAATAPGAEIPLTVTAGGQTSNAVVFALQ